MRSSAALPLLCAIVIFGVCRAKDLHTQISASANGGDIVSKLIAAAGTSSSSGSSKSDQVHQELSQSVDAANDNMMAGFKLLMEPAVNFMVHTTPNLLHLYSITQTGTPVRRDVANFAKDLWGQGAVKLAQFTGQGMVTGSNLAKGAMELSAKALNGVNGAINKVAETGIDVAYKIVDVTMEIEMKKIEMMTKALEEFGKVLDNAGTNMEAYAADIQAVLKGVDGKVNLTIENLKKVSAKVLSDGVQTLADGSHKFQEDAYRFFVKWMKIYDSKLKELQTQLGATRDKVSAVESGSMSVSLDGELDASNINAHLSSATASGTNYYSAATASNNNENTDGSDDALVWTNTGDTAFSTNGDLNVAELVN